MAARRRPPCPGQPASGAPVSGHLGHRPSRSDPAHRPGPGGTLVVRPGVADAGGVGGAHAGRDSGDTRGFRSHRAKAPVPGSQTSGRGRRPTRWGTAARIRTLANAERRPFRGRVGFAGVLPLLVIAAIAINPVSFGGGSEQDASGAGASDAGARATSPPTSAASPTSIPTATPTSGSAPGDGGGGPGIIDGSSTGPDCISIEAERFPLTGAWSPLGDDTADGGSFIVWSPGNASPGPPRPIMTERSPRSPSTSIGAGIYTVQLAGAAHGHAIDRIVIHRDSVDRADAVVGRCGN